MWFCQVWDGRTSLAKWAEAVEDFKLRARERVQAELDAKAERDETAAEPKPRSLGSPENFKQPWGS